MRLRPRPRRPSPDGLNAPLPGTTIGNLDSPARARVDRGGAVAVVGQGWVLEWWVGAEDRWHLPVREVAVRQELLGASPVVETRVRVPGGDAVAHAYGARGPRGEDLAALEVRNDTATPFALALVVRPAPRGRISSLALDGTTVTIDGVARVHLPRPPGRVAMSSVDDLRDAAAILLAGDAGPEAAQDVRCRHGGAQAALVFPLTHSAAFRAAVSLDAAPTVAPPVDPITLPGARQVASGWATHSRGGTRVELPDRRLREAIAAATRSLLLDGDGPVVRRALDQLGFPFEAATRTGDGEPSEALVARADAWRLHRRAASGAEVPWLASLVERWARGAGDDGALPALSSIADLFDAAGEHRAAADVRAVLARRPAVAAPPPADLHRLLGEAGSTLTWGDQRGVPDPTAAARFLLAVRAHLVDDAAEDLVLSPVVPDGWLGQGWEVHDLPTAHGRVSFAIRWHGERPALLWELEPRQPSAPVRLRCSLDDGWSTTTPAGDALLAPVVVPERPARRRGLAIPVTIEPTRRGPA